MFQVGDRVEATPELRASDWSKEAKALRSQAAMRRGTVVARHDSHGLCFDVELDDTGAVVSYEPSELSLLAKKADR